MKSTLMSRRDLDFLLFEWLRVDELLKRPRFAHHTTETFADVLTLCEELAERHFAPHYKRSDAEEPTLRDGTVTVLPEIKDALRAFADTELLAMTLDEQYGGAQVPVVVSTAAFTWLNAANFSTSSYPLLTLANCNLLVEFGTEDQIAAFVPPMLAGRFTGTMCLSEPQAGSSLSDITTRAVPQDDGTYRLFGSKMWISGGDHDASENIVHLVLAKLPRSPRGTKGISLFIVPKFLVAEDGSLGERNDVVPAGLNHKMGQRGLANLALNFGEGAFEPGGATGAVGYLVGQPHHGLAYMFHMMNEARLMTGSGATALGYTGYLKSLDYARMRPQGRPLSAKEPDTAPVPIIEHPDVKRMLLAQKSYVEGALALVLYCARLTDIAAGAETPEERGDATELLDLLTPITKSWPAQWCVQASDLAIQIHGGYGYTREYDVEQLYRDNRINPIHEGTHGIQSLDLLGRKVRQHGGAGLRLLEQEVTTTITRATAFGGEPAQLAAQLQASWQALRDVTTVLLSCGDPTVALANSALYLEAFGHIVVAWLWLDQVLAAHGREDDFYVGKRYAARYFYRYELPKTKAQLELLRTLDLTTVEATFDGWEA
ncbi:acyl-CoA dehydrogenase [Mycobacterium sp. 852013-50091_SCH5140682]|uniref:acyl-CoA dehydrogenase n=1 Tax=Mycobacterium sp. 852013-50091_SCH5140682 TaxID=1834109 RepID=UPI0007EAB8DC|nr:acyl-CoA dehydrogenase [Mycobacterium sp. 852013-50091_SCH5140682]OBC08182.1 acyl-CoA dehydrogenase [Mycobacterium sp. 852013-50091_SCH5140682]